MPFAVIPVAAGTLVTLFLVNTFPARRARDLLMLMGLLFAASLVILLRFIRPEQLLKVESLPDLTDFFATLQSPVTPLLPSFWAGETLFASLHGGLDPAALRRALDDGARGRRPGPHGERAVVLQPASAGRRKRRRRGSRSCAALDALVRRAAALDRPAPAAHQGSEDRSCATSASGRSCCCWSRSCFVYLYNFRVLDLERIPYMTGFVKNVYAFVNLGMAGFVMATVAVRFVFPAVSAEGAAFWIIRTSPISMRDFLWSKFWTGLVPVLALTEVLTIAANELLGVDPFLKVMAALAIVFMSFALVRARRSGSARAIRGSTPTPRRWPARTAASRS